MNKHVNTEYHDDNLTILTDLRSPYTSLGIHPEWRDQFIRTIRRPKVHQRLSQKLAPFAPFVLFYTKIWPDEGYIREVTGYGDRATICIMSSVGEHAMTSWLVLHNIAHTVISQNMWVKAEVKATLGLGGDDYRIAPIQAQLVDCASARLGMIPNINELIYELFASWIWHGVWDDGKWIGKTASPHEKLRHYCDWTFAEIMALMRGQYFWHRYRCPAGMSDAEQPWLEEVVRESRGVSLPPTPGKPGFSRPGMFAPIIGR